MRATKGTTKGTTTRTNTRLVDQGLKFSCLIAGTAAFGLAMVVGAAAYDGTNCKAPGNCWEPKPGYPAQVAGSKYDPKHDPRELNKQQESIKGMEARNAQRVDYFQKTGKFVYDVSKIPSAN